MIAVIFEVEPHAGCAQRYLELAAALRVHAEAIDGFIGIERFESLTRPGRFLSLSLWRDADAVRAWHEHAGHRSAQQLGREELFASYRIRVATIVREHGRDA